MRGGWWRAAPVGVAAVVATVTALATPARAATEDVVAFVRSTHEVLLGQLPSDEDVGRWAPVVERGRADFTAALTDSPEWARHQVALLYRKHLLREPERDALQHWAALIDGGGEPRDVEAHVLASPEHRARHRASDAGALVDLLYRTALGRDADEAGRAHWVAQLDGSGSPVAVAGHLLASPEGQLRRVDRSYREILDRPAEAVEQAAWMPHLARAGQAALDATLAASEERYTRVTGTVPVVIATTNLSGWQTHRGELAPADTVVGLVTGIRPRPAAIGLVEVCATGESAAPGQLEHLTAELEPLGYSIVWSPSIQAFARPGCRDYGNALAIRGDVRSTETLEFDAQRLDPSRGYEERRNAVCADAVVGGRQISACTTHLVNPLAADVETTRRQAAEALRFVTSTAGPLRLVAGDLNLSPSDPALEGWYAELREADPAGRDATRATTDGGTKVDYAFASPLGTSSVTRLDAVSVATSDHHWIAGTFRLLP